MNMTEPTVESTMAPAATFFQTFAIDPTIQAALDLLGYTTPTPIQEKAIPIIMNRRDLVGCAQTGTGKTAAFSIPALNMVLAQPQAQVLILAPTRELVLQIQAFWRDLTKTNPHILSVSVIGGAPMPAQTRQLGRNPQVIVATPGRLLDHLKRGTVNLKRVRFLVLDEADRMLDMGFAPQLEKIQSYLSGERQTLLFTATWDSKLDGIARKFLKNPERVTVGPTSRPVDAIEQKTVHTSVQQKNDVLLDELNARQDGSVLIFARTQIRTDRLARALRNAGVECGTIHGGLRQNQRTSALRAFRAGEVRIMVATDIAARGIDISQIHHVINFDLPQCADDYIHRIGRTGRAGAKGQALSILTPEDRGAWSQISKLLGKGGIGVGPQKFDAEKSATSKSSSQNDARPQRENKGQRGFSRGGSRWTKPKRRGPSQAHT